MTELENLTPHFAKRHLEGTLAGDPKSAFALQCAMPNDHTGRACLALFMADCPAPAFRAFLEATWEHDYQHLLMAITARRELALMFSYAEFPEKEMPERFRVWRGVSGIGIDEARLGMSWTTDRDTAVWFANRLATPKHRPLVIAADISPDDVALYCDGREEYEVVVIDHRSVAGAWIDGGDQ